MKSVFNHSQPLCASFGVFTLLPEILFPLINLWSWQWRKYLHL